MHAQDSCACTRILCMHKNLVHAQECCACIRIRCMNKNLVHAQESCACTTTICKQWCFCQNTFFHEWAPYGRWGGHPAAKIRVVAMHVFFIFMISQKQSVFRPVDVSWFFGHLSWFWTKNKFFQKWPRSVRECSGGIPDLSGPIFNPFWRKSPKT